MDKTEGIEMQDSVKRTDVTVQQAPDYLRGRFEHKEPRNVSPAHTSDKSGKMDGEQTRIRVQAFHVAVA
jgi:hypothetical protein